MLALWGWLVLAAGEPTERFDVYQLDLARDGAIVGTAAVMWTAYLVQDRGPRPDPCGMRLPGGPCDPATINGFDDIALHHLSENAGSASDVLRVLSIGWPLALDLLTMPSRHWDGRARGFGEDAVLLGEILALTNGAENLLKIGTLRLRPSVYQGNPLPPGSTRLLDDFASFPSGHTTDSFAGATFACLTFARRTHTSIAKIASVCAPGYAVAIATGVLRIEAGQHFPTDVIAGAALGVGIGLAVPLLHHDPRPAAGASEIHAIPTLLPTPGGVALGMVGSF